jgi:hypothetical protein
LKVMRGGRLTADPLQTQAMRIFRSRNWNCLGTDLDSKDRTLQAIATPPLAVLSCRKIQQNLSP